MTPTERMIEAIRHSVRGRAIYSGSIKISMRRTARGEDRYVVGGAVWSPTLEEALLGLADRMRIPVDEAPDTTEAVEQLRASRTEARAERDKVVGLEQRIKELEKALKPWAELEEKFVIAWGMRVEWEQARIVLHP